MPARPDDGDACGRLAWLGCDCCGRTARRIVPSSFGSGHETGLACGDMGCRLCAGPCRATLVVVDNALADPAPGATGSGDGATGARGVAGDAGTNGPALGHGAHHGAGRSEAGAT